MTHWFLSLSALLVVVVLISLASGDYPLPVAEVLGALSQDPGISPEAMLVVYELRLPRLLVAALAGMALAVSGVLVQAVMRNPLAEPGLLGINAGAALAVVLVVIAWPGLLPLSVAGFAGALLSALALWRLAWRGGIAPLRLVLIGIALSTLAAAAATVLTTFARVDQAQRVLIWLAGSLHEVDASRPPAMAPWVLIPLVLSLFTCRAADLITCGDTMARSLGQRVEATRALLIILAALLAGSAVAFAGPIGFVGLIAPHLGRWMAGPLHRHLLPLSAMVGAVLVSSADLAGRVALAPIQIPAGLVTALIGGPFFFWLIWRQRHARR